MAAAAKRPPAKASFEDDYLRSRDDNITLKRTCHDQQETIKRLTAKMVMIEETLRRAADGTAAQKLVFAEQRIHALQEENDGLTKRMRVLSDKLRIAEETLRVRAKLHGSAVPPGRVPRPGSGKSAQGVAGMRASGERRPHSARSSSRGRSGSRSPSSVRSASRSPHTEARRPSAGSPADPPVVSPRPAGIAMRDDAAVTHAHISSLMRENDALRQQLQVRSMVATEASSVAVPRSDAVELERQLRDKTAQILLLKGRFEHLEAKSTAERTLYDRAVAALEEQNAALRDTRAALQAAEADVSIMRTRLTSIHQLEEELRRTKDECHRLEASLTELVDAPFMHDGREALSLKQRLEASTALEKQLRDQVSHLQQSLRTHHAELQVTRRERDELQTSMDALKDEAAAAKSTADATTRANVMLRERLALYGGGSLDGVAAVPGDVLSIPPHELERALTIVRRRMDRPAGAAEEDESGETRRKLQQLQLALVTAQGEIDRTDRMLKAQTAIAQDMSAEVASLNARLSTETAALKTKLNDTETLAEARLQRVHMLEAQVRTLLADAKTRTSTQRGTADADVLPSAASSIVSGITRHTHTRPRGTEAAGRTGAHVGVDDEEGSVISDVSFEEYAPARLPEPPAPRMSGPARVQDDETSVDGSDARSDAHMLDFAPGENNLEIYVVGATFDPAMLGRFTTTFALIDFMHFESQASPLGEGHTPTYNFSSMYRIPVDAYTLRYLATTGGSVDVMQQRGADYALLARATVPMHALLGATTRVRLHNLPLRTHDGKAVGSIKVELRVGVSLAEAWQAMLRDRPAEGAHIAALIRTREIGEQEGVLSFPTADGMHTGLMDPSRPAPNDLIVTIASATGLRSRSGVRPPSAYIQYTIPTPGAKTAFTPVVPRTSDPVYADTRSFPVVPTLTLLSHMQSHPLTLVVCDDDVPSHADATYAAPAHPSTHARSNSHRAILGTVQVSLVHVCEGMDVGGTYDIVDEAGRCVGKLSVRIVWSRPLLPVDGVAADTLTRAQFHALAALFDRDGAGVKFQLLARVLCMSARDAQACERVRDAITSHTREQRVNAATSAAPSAHTGTRTRTRLWLDALHAAAEAAARTGSRVTPREVYDALTHPSVGMAVDLHTVEDAVCALLGDGESSVRVADLCDALAPHTSMAALALMKARAFMAPIVSRNGMDFIMRKMEEAAVAEGSSDSQGRCSRAALAQSLRAFGIIIVEESISRMSARDPRDATDFPPSRTDSELMELEPVRAPATSVSVAAPVARVPAATSGMRSSARDLVWDLYAAADALSMRAQTGTPAPAPARQATPAHFDTHSMSGASTLTPTDDETADKRAVAHAGREVNTRIVDEQVAPAPVVAPAPAPVPAPASAPIQSAAPAPEEPVPESARVVGVPTQVYTYLGPLKRGHEGISVTVARVTRVHAACVRLFSAIASLCPPGAPANVYISYIFPRQHVRVYAHSDGALMRPRVVSFALNLDGITAAGATATAVATAHDGEGLRATVGSTTTFPVLLPDPSAPPENIKQSAATSLGAYLAQALAPGAVPEHADIEFLLSLTPPGTLTAATSESTDTLQDASAVAGVPAADVLASSVFSLHDILDDHRDVDVAHGALPLQASEALAAVMERYAGRMRYLANEEAAQATTDAARSTWTPSVLPAHTTLCDLSFGVQALSALEKLRRR